MLDFPPWKIWAIALTMLAAAIVAAPNFLSEKQAASLPSPIPSRWRLAIVSTQNTNCPLS